MLIANLPECRIASETGEHTFVRSYLGEVSLWAGPWQFPDCIHCCEKTLLNCRQDLSLGGDLGSVRGEREADRREHSSLCFFPVDAMSPRLLLHHEWPVPRTVGQNEPFLPYIALFPQQQKHN